VIITLDTDYRLDLTKSNLNNLIGFDKVILDKGVNIGNRTPNISKGSDALNIHCDLISDSLVNGEESDIIFSFGTGTLRASYNFWFRTKVHHIQSHQQNKYFKYSYLCH